MIYQYKEVPFPSRVEEFRGYGLEDVKLARDLLSRGCRVEAVGVLRTALTAFEIGGDGILVNEITRVINVLYSGDIVSALSWIDAILAKYQE